MSKCVNCEVDRPEVIGNAVVCDECAELADVEVGAAADMEAEARTKEAWAVHQVRDYARHTTGTERYHKSILSGFVYTDGVLYLAETVGAHWLIDGIASHQVRAALHGAHFQCWRLEAPKDDGDPWALTCWSDVPGKSTNLARQKIPYSDFPRDLTPLDLWVEGGVLLLPDEH